MKKNKLKNRGIIIASSVVLGIIFILFMLVDFHNAVQNSVTIYRDNQNRLVASMMEKAVAKAEQSGDALTDTVVADIQEDFPTSSSVYCIFAKNDDIVFLKDENTTSTLTDEKISTYFNKNNVSLRDQKKYIISKVHRRYQGESYTLAVCTRQNYFVQKINFDEIQLHCIGYFIMYGAVLIILLVFSFYRLHTEEKTIVSLDDEVKRNRRIIERLENDKNKNYVDSEREENYSFYDRSIVDEVIACMTEEEKEKCIQVDIYVENLKMEHFVLITAILGRIKQGRSIACYWAENQFKVLLFDPGKEEVPGFINLFISKYKTESKEKVEELKIVATRLLGGNDEI